MSPAQTVARADALYFSVAISVTLIELAVLATTPSLGKHALEQSLVAQLVVSLTIEFWAARIILHRLGIIRATRAGFMLKTLSCGAFFGGVILAERMLIPGWTLILLSFLLDAMGTGLLKASFRPAYSLLHVTNTGQHADFVGILRQYKAVRLGMPCALLLGLGAIHGQLDSTARLYVMFALVVSCRISQMVLSWRDLRLLTPGPPAIARSSTCHARRSPVAALTKAPTLWAAYLLGTVLESIVLMYGLGLIYRYTRHINTPEALAWMGASAVSLWIYLISYVGAATVVAWWDRLKNSKLGPLLCACAAILLTRLLWLDTESSGYAIGLVGFCVSASVIAILMTRHASTGLLMLYTEQDCAGLFIWAELGANAALVGIVCLTVWVMGPDSIVQLFGLLLGVAAGLALVARFIALRKEGSRD